MTFECKRGKKRVMFIIILSYLTRCIKDKSPEKPDLHKKASRRYKEGMVWKEMAKRRMRWGSRGKRETLSDKRY